MKTSLLFLALCLAFSCNNTAGSNENKPHKENIDNPDNAAAKATPANDCGVSLYFKKGSRIASRTMDANGKVLSIQESVVDRVYNDGAMLVTEMQTSSSDADGSNSRKMKGIYRCDGTNMLMDLSGLVETKEGMTISSTGVPFPLKLSGGDVLPESKYTVTVNTGGKKMKINATIKDRKVEDRKAVTVGAGTFNCYKITSTIDAVTEMEGMTEQMRQAMEKAKSAMPKNIMIIWFDPEVAVVKMEVYMGSNLLSRTEITSVSK